MGKPCHAGGVHLPVQKNGALRVVFRIAPGGHDPPKLRTFLTINIFSNVATAHFKTL
ncbi:MAG TPA: hypothetical protein VGM54_15940 [Chthoniobacter sp.]